LEVDLKITNRLIKVRGHYLVVYQLLQSVHERTKTGDATRFAKLRSRFCRVCGKYYTWLLLTE